MTIRLHEQLKKLRRDRGGTQGDLARHLGVTDQAVSKWERGEGFPDIQLLPAIASYYGVTVDDLLGVGQLEKEKKIKEYQDRSIELKLQGKTEEDLALWRQAIGEFPNELPVVHGLMYAMMNCDQETYADEIIACGERLLEESTDSAMRSGAIQCLSFTYYEIKGDAETAKKYARMATTIYHATINELMPHFLEGDEAVRYCQSNIQSLVDLIGNNVSWICRKGDFGPAEILTAYRFVIALFDLLYPDGNAGFYHNRYMLYCESMARQHGKLGDEAEMFRCLEKAAFHAIRYDTPEEGCYTAFMVNKVEMDKSGAKTFQENMSGWLLKKLQGADYDPWREDERLLRVMEKLRPVAVI